ncbi:putative enterotoxin [Ophiocordyceps australis]|uniref:Putative enterotoxin n=1 Tax=Ophiocordyceps australis TaxID=1399860 RepID=A0A2C5YG61_9HYPO|nr:putative enterotoxin [Ophiocordyceps australis]
MASIQSLGQVILLTLLSLLVSLNKAEEQPAIRPDKKQGVAYYVTETAPDVFRGAQRIKSPCKQSNAKPDLSLWRHAYPEDFNPYYHSTCPYIFLHSSARRALEQARRHLKSYIYSVHLDERSISLKNTFGSHHKRFEDRWAILGDLLYRQIENWRVVERGSYSAIVLNSDFDWLYYFGDTAYGAAPQLAGFPMTHPALTMDPWNKQICPFNYTELPEQQTCQPDPSYTLEFTELPQGIMARFRDGRLFPAECADLLVVLQAYLPELKKRIEKYLYDSACQHIQNMVSLLACPKVQDLNVTLEIGSMSYAGTYDTIKFTIGGEKNEWDTVAMGSYFSAGWKNTRTVDLLTGFKRKAVPLDDIHYLKVIDKWSESSIGGDAWYCKSIDLRGRCAGTNQEVAVTKLRNLERWYQHQGDDVAFVVQNFWLFPRDWKQVVQHDGSEIAWRLGPISALQANCWRNLRNLRECLKTHWTQIQSNTMEPDTDVGVA